jgi:TolA-binding protein
LETEDELRELRREVIESRGLVIKTNNLVNALSSDLKSIAKRQTGYERRITWNSATAYGIFVLTVLLGVKVLYDYALENRESESGRLKAEVTQLRSQLEELKKRDEARGKVDTRAAALYELVRANKRSQLIEELASPANKDALTKTELAFFGDIAERYRNELALESYYAGLDHAKFARWAEAATALEESIKIKGDAATAPAARLALARAYVQLNRPRDAVPMLSALSENAPDKDIQASATWELANVEKEIQAWNDAKATLRAFLKKFPTHAHASDAQQLLAELTLKH